MNCHDFGLRLHECLDERISVDGDRELQRHADGCDSCRAELDAWQQIASIMPTPPVDQHTSSTVNHTANRTLVAPTGMTAAGLAAALLIAFTWFHREPDTVAELVSQSNAPELLDDSPVTHERQDQHDQDGELNPAAWWQDVRNHDWMGKTMPAVESVRDGVAPLGRSLIRAVSLLAVGGGNRTS